LLSDSDVWRKHSRNGLENVAKKYSWENHAQAYIKAMQTIVSEHTETIISPAIRKAHRHVKRLIITDLDKTLLSDTKGLKEFVSLIRKKRKHCAFGIATARRLNSVLAVLKHHDIPRPDILITSLGTEVYYSQELTLSTDWARHVDHNWNPKAIRRILSKLPGLHLQDDSEQGKLKISYDLDDSVVGVLSKNEIISLLRKEEQTVNVFLTAGRKLDIVPARASKGLALRYVASIWDIPTENILVAGGSGTDEDMMSGNTLAVVVNNRQHESLELEHQDRHIYFANSANALGILEAIDHYQFFPETESATH
jgi:sucrose-phosphate synthase